MYGFGPISGAPYSTPPADPDPPYLWAGRSWETIGGTQRALVRGERYETPGVFSRIHQRVERWNTRGAVRALCERGERWITQAAFGELVREEFWATLVPQINATPRDEAFAVTGVALAGLPAWTGWATDGAPLYISVRDERWATVAPVVRALDAWRGWAARAPVLSFLVSDRRWATFVPAFSILTREERWFFNLMIAAELEIAYAGGVAAELAIVYPLGADTVAAEIEIASPLLTQVAAEIDLASPIREFDVVAGELEMRYSILDGAVIFAVDAPTLTVRGQTLRVDDVEIATDEGAYAWTCQVVLPDPDRQLALFGADEPFEIALGGETYAFIRQDVQVSRSGPARRGASISGISPSAVYAAPRAARVTKTWKDATLVSAILEELFGADVVELRVLDWAVPAGRLAVTNQAPVEIAQSLARATGALLESEPEGSLYIRYLWPVSVPFLEAATPDHVFDDARDVYTLESRVAPQRIENAFRILDVAAGSGGLLQAEIDARENGFNAGRTQFAPGEQPALLIFTSSDVALDSVRASAGNIAPLASGTRQVTEQITFADTTEAALRYPTAAIDSYEWLGNDLGVPELSGELTVRVPGAGVGVLRVTYTSAFAARRLSGVPATLAGESEYDVLVVVEGSQT